MSDNIAAVMVLFFGTLYNICLLLCTTYLVVTYNNFWFLLLLLFTREIHFKSSNKSESEDK